LGGLVDAVTAIRGVAKITQFTYFDEAQQQLALYGAVSMLFFGAIYYFVPRVAGRAWASVALVQGHYLLVLLGLALLIGSLARAGLIQGHDLNDAKVPFTEIALHTKSTLLVATAAQGLLLLGNLLLRA